MIHKSKWRLNKQGYWENENFYKLHRKLYSIYYGPIPMSWEVHHCDRNPKNNNIENLIALPKEIHRKVHREINKKGRNLSREEIIRQYGDGKLRPRRPKAKKKKKKKPKERWGNIGKSLKISPLHMEMKRKGNIIF